MYELTAEVISQKGHCGAGHKVGDKFTIGQMTTPNMCSWAYFAIFTFAEVLEFGGAFPWEKEGEATIACPDADNPVVFKLKRNPRQHSHRHTEEKIGQPLEEY